jgi:hypothetical protein
MRPNDVSPARLLGLSGSQMRRKMMCSMAGVSTCIAGPAAMSERLDMHMRAEAQPDRHSAVEMCALGIHCNHRAPGIHCNQSKHLLLGIGSPLQHGQHNASQRHCQVLLRRLLLHCQVQEVGDHLWADGTCSGRLSRCTLLPALWCSSIVLLRSIYEQARDAMTAK